MVDCHEVGCTAYIYRRPAYLNYLLGVYLSNLGCAHKLVAVCRGLCIGSGLTACWVGTDCLIKRTCNYTKQHLDKSQRENIPDPEGNEFYLLVSIHMFFCIGMNNTLTFLPGSQEEFLLGSSFPLKSNPYVFCWVSKIVASKLYMH